jgi:hypothetical protein
VFFVVLSIMIGAAGAEDDTARSLTLFKKAGAVIFSVGTRSVADTVSAMTLPKLALAVPAPVNVGCS